MTQFFRRTGRAQVQPGMAQLIALGLMVWPALGLAQQRPQGAGPAAGPVGQAPASQVVPRWQPDLTPPAATVAPTPPLPLAPAVQPPPMPAIPPAEPLMQPAPTEPVAVPVVPVVPGPEAKPQEPASPLFSGAGETLPKPPPIRPIFISKAVPRALFLTFGWTYTPSNSLPLNRTPGDMKPQTLNGLNIDGALLWQVRGFDGVSWPAWIGFMPSFYYLFGDIGQRDFLGMGYGIYVKHALWPRERFRLFFAYGLGATQVWVRDVDSRGIGHLTRLAVGMDVHLRKWLQLTFEFSYRFYNLPMLKLAETDALGYDFHSLNLQAGLWFGR